ERVGECAPEQPIAQQIAVVLQAYKPRRPRPCCVIEADHQAPPQRIQLKRAKQQHKRQHKQIRRSPCLHLPPVPLSFHCSNSPKATRRRSCSASSFSHCCTCCCKPSAP